MKTAFHPARFRRSAMALGLAFLAFGFTGTASAADHKDSPDSDEGNLDITDWYVFSHGDNMVFITNVSPFLTPGAATTEAAFNPNGLYQFKLDKERDGVEEAVIQVGFTGSGTSQKVWARGPGVPEVKGVNGNKVLKSNAITGDFNTAFSGNGLKVFAGPRDDSFFIHLLGDSSVHSVLNAAYAAALKAPVGDPKEQSLAFSKSGPDDVKGANVLSIVVELPKSMIASTLGIAADGTFFSWATTSKKK
ncbi:MAG: molecular chaperone DnaK [Fibrobacteres bacterium]|nr:molecular chaperone DnaK [Fibrobacterota bacterium]